MSPTRRVTFKVDSRLEDATLVGMAVGRIAGFGGLDEICSHHIEVCVMEAVNNSIRHGYREEPDHCVFVDVVVVEDEELRVEVRDDGVPFAESPSEAPGVSFDPEDLEALPTGGLGLQIIFDVMDNVKFERRDGWNVLAMRKSIHTEKTGA